MRQASSDRAAVMCPLHLTNCLSHGAAVHDGVVQMCLQNARMLQRRLAKAESDREPNTNCTCSRQHKNATLTGRLERPTSRLTVLHSNQLSYASSLVPNSTNHTVYVLAVVVVQCSLTLHSPQQSHLPLRLVRSKMRTTHLTRIPHAVRAKQCNIACCCRPVYRQVSWPHS